jgi:hypothetical protein
VLGSDLDLFTSTNISQRSQQVGKAISNAMMNNDTCWVPSALATGQQ